MPAWPLGPLETAWCAAALFAGYAVRGAAGFGSGVVATPLMAFVLPLSTVAPLITFIGAFVSIRQAVIDWPLIAWKHLAAFVPGIVLGVPLGIYSGRSRRGEQIVRPVLDFMQTMPAFVYLIPAVLFFHLGEVPGAMATVIFAMPPCVRLTTLGLKGDQFKQKMELTSILTKMGLKPEQRRVQGGRLRGYCGIWYRGEKIALDGDIRL